MKKIIFLLFFIILQPSYSRWQSVMKDLQSMGGVFTAIAAKGDKVYAAGGYRDKIYMSTDKGTTWRATSGPTPVWISSIIIQDSIVFASGESNIYYTTNNGEKWDIWEIYQNTSYGLISTFEISGHNWYVGFYRADPQIDTISGILVSHDDGNLSSFKRIEFENDMIVNTIQVKGDSVFAGTSDGLYLSIDYGDTWDKIGFDSIDVRSLVIKENIILVGALYGGIYLSSNNGLTHQKVGLDSLTPTIVIKDDYIFAGTVKGVYFSTDNGYSWQQTSLTYASVPSLVIDGDNIYAAASKYNSTLQAGIFLSTDNGNNWKKIGIKGGSPVRCVAVKDNIVFADGGNGLRISTNNGKNWQLTELSNLRPGGDIYNIVFDKENIFVKVDYFLFLSTDKGKTWENVISEESELPSFTSFTVKGDSIYGGDPWGFGGVWLSTDYGRTWKNTNTCYTYVFAVASKGDRIFMGAWDGLYQLTNMMQNPENGLGYWKRLLYDPSITSIVTDDKMIFAGGADGMYISSDDGDTWEKSGPMNSAQTLAVQDSTIAVGSGWEVYLSTDYGASWQITGLDTSYLAPLTGMHVNAVAINADTIFAATYSGLFRYIIGDTSTVEDTVDVSARQAILDQEYFLFPNPARDYIQINDVEMLAGSRYIITDLLGQELQSGVLESNRIAVSVLPRGMYILIISNGVSHYPMKFIK